MPQQEGSGLELFCVEFARSPTVCTGFFQMLWFSFQSPKICRFSTNWLPHIALRCEHECGWLSDSVIAPDTLVTCLRCPQPQTTCPRQHKTKIGNKNVKEEERVYFFNGFTAALIVLYFRLVSFF